MGFLAGNPRNSNGLLGVTQAGRGKGGGKLGGSKGRGNLGGSGPGGSKNPNAGGGGGDPFFGSVTLLMHMEGPNGSTTFTDSSSSARTVLPDGDVIISTAQKKFGNSSCFFDGSGDVIYTADAPSMRVGASDFTYEGWIRPSVIDGNTRTIYCKGTHLGTPAQLEMRFIYNSLGILVQFSNGTAVSTLSANGSFFTVDTWSHYAVVRSGNEFMVFIDGVRLIFSNPPEFEAGEAVNGVGSSFLMGQDATGSNTISGYLDEIRLTKGVARYTANFTPPTAPFPDS